MTLHLHRDLDYLHRHMLALSAMVERMIDQAAKALHERDEKLAEEIIRYDDQVDNSEVRLEEECLKMLALHQPVAKDLRRIATVMKVNNELERIADMAVNIAQRAMALHQDLDFPIPPGLDLAAEKAARMVRDSLDCFVSLDAKSARFVLLADRELDAITAEIIQQLVEYGREHPSQIHSMLQCFSAARHLERIGDHATNIAEDVIYLVEGHIVRHKKSASIDSSANRVET